MPETKETLTRLEGKIDALTETTGEFQLKATEIMTRLVTTQENCPIHKINGQLKDVRDKVDVAVEKANSAKRLSVMIATGLSVIFSGLVNSMFELLGIPRGQ